MTLDECLTGEQIASEITKKATSRILFLYRQANFLDSKRKKMVASALIQCHFDYTSSSWFSSLTQKTKNKLQITQNKMIRYILDLQPRDHIGKEQFDQVSMLNVCNRVTQLKLCHVFKIFHKQSPHYLQEYFHRPSESHSHNTRGSRFYYSKPKLNGQIKNTFYATAIDKWNSLSPAMKQLINYKCFKSDVKKLLMLSQ